MVKKFMLGANYWDSVSGTDMWKKWNPDEIEKDLAALKKCGVQVLRVFPNWRDFQPIKILYGCQGRLGEYVLGEEEKDISNDEFCLDPIMIDRFRAFTQIAKKYDMDLVVSIITGWMSGRLFVPSALEGKNLITDTECLMWMTKFIKGFVTNVKDIDNIIMWDLGNECNNLGIANSRYDAYVWTALVRNTILSVDNTREISSGMHGLFVNEREWQIADQGELCDYVTTHPYPSPTIGADTEPYNGLRPSILPTAQSEYYASLAKKPCIIQESGVFALSLGNREMGADWVRVNILSALANGYRGYLFWVGMEHAHLKQAPYSWCNMERELGLVDSDRKPKPVGLAMNKLSAVVEALPNTLQKKSDAICVLTKQIDKYEVAAASYVMAKEAGFNIKFVNEGCEVEKSNVYLMPCINGWGVLHVRTWDSILKHVREGADLYISFDGGHFNEIESCFGLRSHGVNKADISHEATFDFGTLSYKADTEIFLENTTAEVLARNEDGNVVFAKNACGKGNIYFLNMPIEKLAFAVNGGLNPKKGQPYYEVYKIFGKKLRDSYLLKTENPNIGITECVGDDGELYVFAINYNNETEKVDFLSEKDKNCYEVVYGNTQTISACDGLILRKK